MVLQVYVSTVGGKDFTLYGYGRRSTRVHADTYGGWDVLRDRYDVTVTDSQPKTSKIENNNKKEKKAITRV